MTRADLEVRISDIQQDLIDVSLAYDVWRQFTDAENREAFEGTMARFPRYFEATIHASLVTVVVTCYRLFEDRNKTSNFRQLRRDFSAGCAPSDVVTKRIEALERQITPLWQKIRILRNNVFGHRSKKLSPEDAFQRVAITPNEIRDLIERMKSLLNVISNVVTGKDCALDINARKDIWKLVADLKKAYGD